MSSGLFYINGVNRVKVYRDRDDYISASNGGYHGYVTFLPSINKFRVELRSGDDNSSEEHIVSHISQILWREEYQPPEIRDTPTAGWYR